MLIIDTHAHLFSPDETRYPPKESPSRPPKGAGTFERLTDEVERSEVRAVTAVQVSGFYGFDNRYVRDVALQNPHWIAGIFTLNPLDTEAPSQLKRFVQEGSMRGLRSVPAPGGRFDHPGVRALWLAATDLGVPINIMADHEAEHQLAALLDEFPSAAAVLDHSLRLQAGPDLEPTLDALGRLSDRRHVYAKLSFIANGEQGCREGSPCGSMHEAVQRVISLFGPERCAWGSHFPTERYAQPLTYSQHLAIYRDRLPLGDRARHQILGETARRLWFPEMDRRP